MIVRTWRDPVDLDIRPLAALSLDPSVARILIRRGISSPSAARAFLDPTHGQLTSPTQLPGMEPAAARIAAAIHRHEALCVWGDFDVDGQTSTSLLVEALTTLGNPPSFHIPLRSREGHGVHIDALASVIERGAQVVLTCDTGVTALEAVEYARARGVDFVITDHHEPGTTLPEAIAVVNPRLLPPDHPLADLSGVGVAFELARMLMEIQGKSTAPLMDLLALGLVADVASLRGDTRLLAQRGIDALRTTSRSGLRLLAELAKADLKTLTEETIGFSLAPRLNAVGRLSDATLAVDLLTTLDPVRANVLAVQVEGLNIRRRLLTEQVDAAVKDMIAADPAVLGQPILLLSNASWPGGVLGIVASKLVERFRKPALLISAGDDGLLHGSARSIEGIDITAAIAANAGCLLGYGGHPMAAGISLHPARLPAFERGLRATAQAMLEAANIQEEVLAIDEWLPLDRLTLGFADALTPLAPFGAGNPAPIFATKNLHLVSASELGRNAKHRRMVVGDQNGVQREVLWWNSADQPLPSGQFDLAYSVRASSYEGEMRMTVQVQDLGLVLEPAVMVRPWRPAIVDWRGLKSRPRLPEESLVWAEASDRVLGFDRLQLHAADSFVIWTSPASRADLKAALAVVQPRKIYLVAIAPHDETVEHFLERLAGMVKYAVNHREGKVSLAELAASTAHRALTIRLGLEWLAAGGQVRLEEQGDSLLLSLGDAGSERDVQAELRAGIRSLLEETAAYREYFARAPAESVVSD